MTSESVHRNRSLLYTILAGLFITNAVTAEMIGGKLIFVGPYLMSVGILPWPVVFLTTDLINEYFGRKVVHRLSAITAILITYCFVILAIALSVPSAKADGLINVSDAAFRSVFGQSLWIIVGSIVAFLFSQLIDVTLFHWVKSKTGHRHIWLRSTGSTVVSQFFDTFIVLGIAFYLPGKMTTDQFISSGFTGYFVKLGIAVLLTPLVYLGHWIIGRYVTEEASGELREN